MTDPFALPQGLVVSPALGERERALLAGFRSADVRLLWPGQPGPRAPWEACRGGCCLELVSQDAQAAAWLRFLVGQFLTPRSAPARERAAGLGLSGGHRVDGRVLVGRSGAAPALVSVVASRVRELLLDDELFPLDPTARALPGDVVELASRRRHSTDR